MKSLSASQFLNALLAPQDLQRPPLNGPLASSIIQWWECSAGGCADGVLVATGSSVRALGAPSMNFESFDGFRPEAAT